MAESNCLAGCIANYICGDLNLPGPANEQAESFAPWVWVKLGQNSDAITVGNKSYSANPHTACIRSFEVGWIDQPSATIEIVDESGSTLGVVANALRKCVPATTGVGTGDKIVFQFGWILTTCQNQKRVIASPKFECILLKLDVNYSEGKIKYKMECGAVNNLDEVMRKDQTRGEDDKPVDIEKAIEYICSTDPPIRVRYCELQPDGNFKDVKFEWARLKDPPQASWQGDNQNRVAIIMKWLAPFRVKDGKCDKGIIPIWAPTKPDELILLKDPSLNPGESLSCPQGAAGNRFGTFIVNGGKCSTVIEFTPTMNVVKAASNFSAGGGTSGPTKTNSNFVEDKKCQRAEEAHKENAGTQSQVTITQQAHDAYGTDVAYQESMKSEIAHQKASRLTNVVGNAVECEMRILGDPSPRMCEMPAGRTASVVVINPFHITGGSTCGDWLARPGCNQLFSNKSWQCFGINHSISAGTYTTTLKLKLSTPGVDVAVDEPLGGLGSNGPNLEGGCSG